MSLAVVLKKASLVGAFFVALTAGGQALAFCPVESDLKQYAVRNIVDGDTVRLSDGRSVRLLGINAPEVGRKGAGDEPYAVAATRRLRELIGQSGNMVGLVAGTEKRDNYGRTLAHLYDRKGNNLESILLQEGLAWQTVIAPNTLLAGCHAAAEQQARDEARGLWRKPVIQPTGDISKPGFALVRGTVRSVERNGGGVWLEMPGSFVVQIPGKHLHYFDWSTLQSLEGKDVEARGWVIDRSRRGSSGRNQARWMLPISHPAMIRVR